MASGSQKDGTNEKPPDHGADQDNRGSDLQVGRHTDGASDGENRDIDPDESVEEIDRIFSLFVIKMVESILFLYTGLLYN